MAFNCPVLTTNSTPWNGLEEFGAGWNLDLIEPDKIKTKIEDLVILDEMNYSNYPKGCTNYIDSFDNEKRLRDNFDLFE